MSEESAKALGISALAMKPIISHEMAQAVREELDQKSKKEDRVR
ncbi:MAG: hypothetical protein ACYDHG_09005 [Desulfomonilaceae bacterium]